MGYALQLVLAAGLVLLGVFMLAFLPKATAFYVELRNAGRITAAEARLRRRKILAGGVAATVVGVGLIVLCVLAMR